MVIDFVAAKEYIELTHFIRSTHSPKSAARILSEISTPEKYRQMKMRWVTLKEKANQAIKTYNGYSTGLEHEMLIRDGYFSFEEYLEFKQLELLMKD